MPKKRFNPEQVVRASAQGIAPGTAWTMRLPIRQATTTQIFFNAGEILAHRALSSSGRMVKRSPTRP
jgi:hypothetical protein